MPILSEPVLHLYFFRIPNLYTVRLRYPYEPSCNFVNTGTVRIPNHDSCVSLRSSQGRNPPTTLSEMSPHSGIFFFDQRSFQNLSALLLLFMVQGTGAFQLNWTGDGDEGLSESGTCRRDTRLSAMQSSINGQRRRP